MLNSPKVKIISGIVDFLKYPLFRNMLSYKLTELKRETNQLRQELRQGEELKSTLQKKLERYSELKELTELLSSSLSLKDAVRFIADESFEIVGKSERSLLFLVDEKKQELTLTSYKNLDKYSKIETKNGDIFNKWVLDYRRPLFVSDVARDGRFSVHKRRHERFFESLVSAPIMLENRTLGILRLEALNRNSYTEDDLHILCVITDISAVAINNAYLYARTEELAIKDGLTGLYVHRYFKERLREEIKRAKRKENKFSLLMIDIDYFKYYNDKYGHVAGDLVLQHIANALHKFADTGDIIARYGGEEFTVILAEEDKTSASTIAEDIRKHIANDFIMLRGRKASATVSIGVAAYPADASGSEDLIKIADNNLYKAKETGRNRVCS